MMTPAGKMLPVNENVAIPRRELWFEFSHSGGPGGQNVNKVETAATLCFSPARSGTLSPAQKGRVLSRLGNRITRDGVLRITARESRSQAANREAAEARLARMLADALKPRKKRKRTRPTRASRERRIEAKKKRSEIKRQRRGIAPY
jgi:ribosome-associated protein